jgi:hypothetical protein
MPLYERIISYRELFAAAGKAQLTVNLAPIELSEHTMRNATVKTKHMRHSFGKVLPTNTAIEVPK